MLRKKQGKLFQDTHEIHPLFAAFSAGTYPILFYYSQNFTLVNTWGHLTYFVITFLVLPALAFWIIYGLFSLGKLKKYQKYCLMFLNVFLFLFLLKVCLYAGIQRKLILLIFFIAATVAYFFYHYFGKIIVFQWILIVFGCIYIIPTAYRHAVYSTAWMRLGDDIEQVVFRNKPNIYLIQPDGYVNFSELKRGYYAMDTVPMEGYLSNRGFVHYDNFRSNYATTLSSNSATFAMKHHYYNKGKSFSEMISARKTIVSNNAVLRILKNNGYQTHFLTESPYLILNKPRLGYDHCNYRLDEVDYIGTGLENKKDILPELETFFREGTGEGPQFFFCEIFNPGHIANRKEETNGKASERKLWLESLQRADDKLKALVALILQHDPHAMVIVLADHGGSVGWEYTRQIYERTQDRDLIYSSFSSQLSIHWPDEVPTEYGRSLKTPVNLFRHVFSYLSKNNVYMQHLEEDGTFIILREGAPEGVYRYIDGSGGIVLEKME